MWSRPRYLPDSLGRWEARLPQFPACECPGGTWARVGPGLFGSFGARVIRIAYPWRSYLSTWTAVRPPPKSEHFVGEVKPLNPAARTRKRFPERLKVNNGKTRRAGAKSFQVAARYAAAGDPTCTRPPAAQSLGRAGAGVPIGRGKVSAWALHPSPEPPASGAQPRVRESAPRRAGS